MIEFWRGSSLKSSYLCTPPNSPDASIPLANRKELRATAFFPSEELLLSKQGQMEEV